MVKATRAFIKIVWGGGLSDYMIICIVNSWPSLIRKGTRSQQEDLGSTRQGPEHGPGV